MWRGWGIAAALVLLGWLLGATQPRLLGFGRKSVDDWVSSGALSDARAPAVRAFERGLPENVRSRNWFQVPASRVGEAVAELWPRTPEDRRLAMAWIGRYGGAEPVLMTTYTALVRSRSGEAFWLLAPRPKWREGGSELTGFVLEKGQNGSSCTCLERSGGCVLRHADFLRCMGQSWRMDWHPHAGVAYEVRSRGAPAGQVEFSMVDNVLTPIRAMFGARGR